MCIYEARWKIKSDNYRFINEYNIFKVLWDQIYLTRIVYCLWQILINKIYWSFSDIKSLISNA